MNILWVENHARFAQIATRTFLMDHAVTVTPSLAEARQALAAQSFDFVLLDYDLDDGKGIELIGALKAIPNRPRLVATSAHADGNNALRQAGADATCSKGNFHNIQQFIDAPAAENDE